MYNMTELYNLINSPIFGNTVSLLSLFIGLFFGAIGIIGEHRCNIVNRLLKLKSYLLNEEAQIKMNITYKPKKEFNLIKEDLKQFLISYDDYNLLKENMISLTIKFDIFTLKIIHNEWDEIFIDVLKTECGVRDLNSKIERFSKVLNEIDRTKGLFEKVKTCQAVIYLPYSWNYVKIYTPKGFTLNNYSIKIKGNDEIFKTEVDISLNSISATGHTFDEIKSLLQKLL
ncbi:hypothetical protein MSSAC_0193 [Methanosarcina siciliae C2J]|uniref:Uncharacterized protein n=2 Tax=Methanosarcina siciliae TaxID=38027 RepID=A0A0E3PIM5_9EURY|nr:hypothetical protein MSSAC_0193 [Methanosarcina siciliae C2J]